MVLYECVTISVTQIVHRTSLLRLLSLFTVDERKCNSVTLQLRPALVACYVQKEHRK